MSTEVDESRADGDAPPPPTSEQVAQGVTDLLDEVGAASSRGSERTIATADTFRITLGVVAAHQGDLEQAPSATANAHSSVNASRFPH